MNSLFTFSSHWTGGMVCVGVIADSINDAIDIIKKALSGDNSMITDSAKLSWSHDSYYIQWMENKENCDIISGSDIHIQWICWTTDESKIVFIDGHDD